MFTFTEDQYSQFKAFLDEMKAINWGAWPNVEKWPRFDGMPGYSLNQYQQDNGKVFVVVKFDCNVGLPDGRKGRRFKVGGGRNYQPICERF